MVALLCIFATMLIAVIGVVGRELLDERDSSGSSSSSASTSAPRSSNAGFSGPPTATLTPILAGGFPGQPSPGIPIPSPAPFFTVPPLATPNTTAKPPIPPTTAAASPTPTRQLVLREITAEGIVSATSVCFDDHTAEAAVDGKFATSWKAKETIGAPAEFRWESPHDQEITAVEVFASQDGEGTFEELVVQVHDASGEVLFVETFDISGRPDPDVLSYPQVVGRSLVLTFPEDEGWRCHGFAELRIWTAG